MPIAVFYHLSVPLAFFQSNPMTRFACVFSLDRMADYRQLTLSKTVFVQKTGKIEAEG